MKINYILPDQEPNNIQNRAFYRLNTTYIFGND